MHCAHHGSCLLTGGVHHKSVAEGKIDPLLEQQFAAGRLYAAISSRPGQSGRCDGYILEGKELEFYIRRLKAGHRK